MPIKFRCTGCRSKLYVPARWHGTSVVCPRCDTRVMVPAGEAATPTSLEGPDIERSLDALEPGAEAFEAAPFALDLEAGSKKRGRDRKRRRSVPSAVPRRGGSRSTVTLPWWVPYACMVALLAVAAGGFALGVWWAAGRG